MSTRRAPSPFGAAAVVGGSVAAHAAIVLDAEASMGPAADAWAVRRARVGLRRLATDLRLLRRYLEPEWADGLRSDAAWYADRLAPVRRLDAVRDRLAQVTISLPPGTTAGLTVVLAELDTQRRGAAKQLAEMRGERHGLLFDTLAEAADSVPLRAGAGPGDLRAVLVRPWREARRAAEAVPAGGDDALFVLRRRVRRLRYAAETVAPAAGPAVARLATWCAELQDTLGVVRDAATVTGWLAALPDPQAAVATTVAAVTAAEEQAATDGRRRWEPQWRTVRRAWRRARR